MKPEEALTMEKLLNELQSVDTVKLVLTGCGESIYGSREVYEAIRPFVEKQVAKKPILIQHPQPYKRDFQCPVCSGDVNRQWEYEHYDDSMIGEEQYEYCPDCGTKIDWSEE